MKKIRVSFKQNDELDDIEVTFSASEKDEEVFSLMKMISDPLVGTLIVCDANGSKVTLAEDRIISISSGNKKLAVCAEDGTYELRMSLQDAEELLNPFMFMRISRYEIINLGKVRRFDFSVTGTLRIEMEDGSETWASRRLIPAIRSRLAGGQ
ncbi:MAG: LytTR family transcriptional regulator DNA-binding domain-containing protein [Mogibacterium sp.]|nr:LytTR family transcriptional regulator DNA-binding domain-containing protein [Mogibacterium sp.]